MTPQRIFIPLAFALLCLGGLTRCAPAALSPHCASSQDCSANQNCLNSVCVLVLQAEVQIPEWTPPQEAATDASQEPQPDASQEGPEGQEASGDENPEVLSDGACIDGQARSCYTGPEGTKGVGSCKAGVQTCQDGAWGPCQQEQTPGNEVCNDKDDDCDGQIDEDFPQKGKACTVGIGACENQGTNKCKEDTTGVQCDALAKPATKEACNDKDDDCDGQIDEDFPTKGSECSVGKGACQQVGKFVCDPNQAEPRCDATAKAGKPETCNGIDDDCDGETDETFEDKGKPCETQQKGLCRNGLKQCQEGKIVCQPTVPPAIERCNDKDDDCDGSIDEDFPQKGQACAVGIGACETRTTYTCRPDGNGVTCNATAGSPSDETCNNKDDDCDGQIDEELTRPCYPESTKGCVKSGDQWVCTGACNTGLQTCQNGHWSTTCQSATKPTTETCNKVDDDCDGQTDEGCQCTPYAKESCGFTCNGTRTCSADGKWGTCAISPAPTPELCDEKDNDCDGQVDETFLRKGKVCTVGVGACQRTGKFICNSTKLGVRCDATAGTPTDETCNGKDDDCDGQIDEGILIEYYPSSASGCTKQSDGTYKCLGTCRAGKRTCSGGQLVSISPPQTPKVETCDNLDNDCDGKADENYTQKGQKCSQGTGECQRTSTFICKPDGSGVYCRVAIGLPTKEACDGKDNDCDGKIDEDLKRDCYTGRVGSLGVGECKAGLQTCQQGVWSKCIGEVTPTTEVCDGKDNDCDNLTDENWSELGAACRNGIGECQTAGKNVCKPDGSGIQCDAVPTAPKAESCNRKDDDCDGPIDEDFPNLGQSCTTNTNGCTYSGKIQCKPDGSGTQCNASTLLSKEICRDGKDNDCDGAVDEICGSDKYSYGVILDDGSTTTKYRSQRGFSGNPVFASRVYTLTPTGGACTTRPLFITPRSVNLHTAAYQCNKTTTANYEVRIGAVSGPTGSNTVSGTRSPFHIVYPHKGANEQWGLMKDSNCLGATAIARNCNLSLSNGTVSIKFLGVGKFQINSSKCTTTNLSQPIFSNIYGSAPNGYTLAVRDVALGSCFIYTYDLNGNLANKAFSFWLPSTSADGGTWAVVSDLGVLVSHNTLGGNVLPTDWSTKRNNDANGNFRNYEVSFQGWGSFSAVLAAPGSALLNASSTQMTSEGYITKGMSLNAFQMNTRNHTPNNFFVLFVQ